MLDFEEFRPDRPYWLSDAGTRVRVIEDPVLAELCGEHAQRLLEAGWRPLRRELADVDRLGNGQRVDHLVRSLWLEAADEDESFGDPARSAGADAFVAWMRGPAQRGGDAGVNRYLYAAYRTRPDLQEAYPDLDGPDGARLIEWAWAHGRREVLAELLPGGAAGSGRAEGEQIAVNVIGYLGEALGLGEAARLYVRSLGAAGVPVSTTAVRPDLPVEEDQRTIERSGSRRYEDVRDPLEPAFNLACLNGDHLQELIRARGIDVLEGRPTIGQWGWETDVLPSSWLGAFEHVIEVWVYSNFMAQNLGRLLPVPVVVVPPPIVAPDPAGGSVHVAQDDRFTFLVMLDFFSTLQRKNPLGAIAAFMRAFAPGEGPRLLIKTINARFRPEADDELRAAAADRPDVEFVDGFLETADKAALISRADCFVSLHRSEGFGLPLAEAMALGTPLIATGYSGNTDFAGPRNSWVVDYSLTRVGPDSEIYPAHGTWAEPDIDHAAELMRQVWSDRGEAERRARRAQADVQERYAPAVVGAIARARLELLADWRAARVPGAGGGVAPGAGLQLDRPALGAVEQALAFDLRKGSAPVPSGAAGAARRLLLRALLPFTFHERQVDRALLTALGQLDGELEAERAERQRDRQRLRRLEALVRESAGDGEPG
jgi:glycosyltransferase involved in cell wall biosynthesis